MMAMALSALLATTVAALLDSHIQAAHIDSRKNLIERDYRAFQRLVDRDDLRPATVQSTAALHWMAPIFSAGGYCSEAHAFLDGLDALSHQQPQPQQGRFRVTAEQHGDSFNPDFVRGLPASQRRRLERLTSQHPTFDGRVVSVCHSEPGAWHINATLPQRYSTSVCPPAASTIRVGRTMFESDRLPDGWAARLNAMMEVWVPTAWAAGVFAEGGVHPDRLLVVPEPVDTAFFDPGTVDLSAYQSAHLHDRAAASHVVALQTRAHIPRRRCAAGEAPGSSAECPYRFLSVGKWERRKGFDVLLRALMTEFTAPPPPQPFVELWILTSSYHSSADFDAQIRQQLSSQPLQCGGSGIGDDRVEIGSLVNPVVRLLTAVPQAELPSVYASVDSFVLASRGEGWGRPHVEAMSMALPVIATAWSGPSEYLNAENGFPLRHTHLEAIPDGAFAGHLMAEPDCGHLRELLRRVVSDPAAASAKGALARRDMIALYSPESVARFVVHHTRRLVAEAAVAASGRAIADTHAEL